MKFLILFLFCGVFCEDPVSTVLPSMVSETVTDLPRNPVKDFLVVPMKSRDKDLEASVEVKADTTWPALITVYEQSSDDEPTSEKNSTSTDPTSEESCSDENMEWNSCGPRCAQTCAFQPRGVRKTRAVCEPLLTSNGCYKGCFCKKDFVRLNDKCVLPDNCPSRSTVQVS